MIDNVLSPVPHASISVPNISCEKVLDEALSIWVYSLREFDFMVITGNFLEEGHLVLVLDWQEPTNHLIEEDSKRPPVY